MEFLSFTDAHRQFFFANYHVLGIRNPQSLYDYQILHKAELFGGRPIYLDMEEEYNAIMGMANLFMGVLSNTSIHKRKTWLDEQGMKLTSDCPYSLISIKQLELFRNGSFYQGQNEKLFYVEIQAHNWLKNHTIVELLKKQRGNEVLQMANKMRQYIDQTGCDISSKKNFMTNVMAHFFLDEVASMNVDNRKLEKFWAILKEQEE